MSDSEEERKDFSSIGSWVMDWLASRDRSKSPYGSKKEANPFDTFEEGSTASTKTLSSIRSGQVLDRPIQLIKITDDGKCIVDPDALRMIEKINTKIGIISVVGPYRTGKSYLLNRLLGRQEGFEIGATV